MRSQHIEPPQPEPQLLPKGHAGPSSHTVRERKKHPRLNGADLYVTRVGWCKGAASTAALPSPLSHPAAVPQEATYPVPVEQELTLSASTSALSSGSLHDELNDRNPSPGPDQNSNESTTIDTSVVRASRPCYRCISYMHSVGIKRVFWTNDGGEWEGGKVRDLVDALDTSMESVASGEGATGGPMGNGVFVTKHEVLMLKRMMGQSDA